MIKLIKEENEYEVLMYDEINESLLVVPISKEEVFKKKH